MTPRQLDNIIRGRAEGENEKIKELWEMHRIQVVMNMAPFLKKEDKEKPIKALYPLPWDKEEKESAVRHTDVNPIDFWKDIDEAFNSKKK